MGQGDAGASDWQGIMTGPIPAEVWGMGERVGRQQAEPAGGMTVRMPDGRVGRVGRRPVDAGTRCCRRGAVILPAHRTVSP